MIFVIINRTDKVIPITRTSMEKVNLLPHKPYVLETLHTPEIHFWQHCTDSRLVVMTDANTIERYLRVLKNQEKKLLLYGRLPIFNPSFRRSYVYNSCGCWRAFPRLGRLYHWRFYSEMEFNFRGGLYCLRFIRFNASYLGAPYR